jgi:large subunit ribosomal protein L18
MNNSATKKLSLQRRHNRVRSKIMGTTVRPRLAIYKSNRYLHAQIIDDTKGMTIVAGSTQTLAKGSKKMDGAKVLGADLAKRAVAVGISEVVFDRGGFRYTGRVAQLATSAREAGLKF